MKGVVPERILARRDKTSFAPLTYLGFRRFRSELADLVEHSPGPLDAVFDRRRLRDAVAEAALGYQPLGELHRLAAALGIAKWIDGLSECSSPGKSEREIHSALPPLDRAVGQSSDRIASAWRSA